MYCAGVINKYADPTTNDESTDACDEAPIAPQESEHFADTEFEGVGGLRPEIATICR